MNIQKRLTFIITCHIQSQKLKPFISLLKKCPLVFISHKDFVDHSSMTKDPTTLELASYLCVKCVKPHCKINIFVH